MGFDFQLHQPPCDISFLAVIDGPVLYNTDDATSGTIKEATIRQIGWHVLQLPDEWFFSEKSRALTERVCHTMQCTIQYLSYRQKKLNEELEMSRFNLQEAREERDAAFEELVELREAIALMKQRYGEGGCRVIKTGSPSCHDNTLGQSFACSLCGNIYPSSSSLESHVVKRHHRGRRYAAMASASAAVLNQMGVADSASFGGNTLVKELASLRADVSCLRTSLTESQHAGRQLEEKISPFSPINVVALPASHLLDPSLPLRDGAYSSLQQKQQEGMITLLQEDLRITKSRLEHIERALQRQEKPKEKQYERLAGTATMAGSSSMKSLRQMNASLASATTVSFRSLHDAAMSSSPLNFSYPRCRTVTYALETTGEGDHDRVSPLTPIGATTTTTAAISAGDGSHLAQFQDGTGMLRHSLPPTRPSVPPQESDASPQNCREMRSSMFQKPGVIAREDAIMIPVAHEHGETSKEETFANVPSSSSNASLDSYMSEKVGYSGTNAPNYVSAGAAVATGFIEVGDAIRAVSRTENECNRNKTELCAADGQVKADASSLPASSYCSSCRITSHHVRKPSKDSLKRFSDSGSFFTQSSAVPSYHSMKHLLEVSDGKVAPPSAHAATPSPSTTNSSCISSGRRESSDSLVESAPQGQDSTLHDVQRVESLSNLPEKAPPSAKVKKRRTSFISKLFGKQKK